MRTTFFAGFAAATLATSIWAQEPVRYEIRFDNRDHHEAQVTATFPAGGKDVVELVMSRSSPGRYALHEFAKNVYDFHATDGRGKPLSVTRPSPHQWNVSGHDGTVVARYTIFGDRCDGTYLAIDNTHAHMNMPATFLWAHGLEDRPIRLTIVVPREDWNVATQLAPTDEKNVFTAPNLYYFFDSPTEVGPIELHEWTVSGKRFRLALHHQGTSEEGAVFAALAQAVVEEEMRVYSELADYDFGTYTFLVDYLPYASGDGMEHRNSTVLTSRRGIQDPIPNLGTVAHEFFHSWNVERMRPRTLEPFDFERANMSGELWFAEGFTSYYDDLSLKRAAIISLDRYARSLGSNVNEIVNAPGRRFFSPVEMSQQAPFVDAAVSVDPTNRENTYASYYPYGAVLALALDLSLRERFPGKSLDDYMRAVWVSHGKTEKPYTLEDLETLLAEVSDRSFAAEFFGRFVRKSELPDLERLLALAGLTLQRPRANEVWLGARVEDTGAVVSRPLAGSPLYEAGVDEGDVIRELDGRAIGEERGISSVVEKLAVGDEISIVFVKRGEVRTSRIRTQGDPGVEIVPFEKTGDPLTAERKAFRESWLEGEARASSVHRRCDRCQRSFPVEMEFCPYDGAALRVESSH